MENTLTLPNQTILLDKQSLLRWLSFTLIFLVQGISNLSREELSPLRQFFGIAAISVSILFLIVAILDGTKISPWSPKVQVNDQKILIKTDLWKRAILLSWQHIRQIHFHPYKIDFETEIGLQSVSYTTDGKKSSEIKQLIRTQADLMGIPVTGN